MAPSRPAPAQAPAPEGIHPPHQRPGNLVARHASPLSLLVLSLIMALGVSGLLGKPTYEITTHPGAADLSIEMPAVIRNGDFYETRIRVHARAPIGKLQIEVSPELWREVTVNAMIPAPESESFKGDAFRFDYAALAAGDTLMVKISAQVNPRLLGSLSGHIRALDDGKLLADGERTMRVMP